MTGAIAHRGPDDEQIHIEPGVALGARRLSIVDLVGRPPADLQRGRLDLGHPERRDLRVSRAPAGARWRAAIRWRRGATPSCGSTCTRTSARGCSPRPAASSPSRSGTARRGRLILGRDRVGICPLYYAEVDGWLLWGSEIKALLASGMVEARPDRKGIDLFFNTFCAGTTRTFFEGIKIDPAGPLSAGPRRPGRAQAVLGPRFSRRRQRAPAGRSDAAGRRAGAPDAPGRRAPAAGRRAGGQLHQRRARLDRRAGPELARAGLRRAVVHDRAGPGRPRRAVARGRVGRGPRLAADDRDA